MGMARIPVAEFRVHSQNASLVRATANAPAQPDNDLRQWAQQSSLSSGGMMMGGLALAAVGGVGALLMNVGFFGMVALSSMITVGGGVAFLGALKLRGRKKKDSEPQLALPASSSTVIAERGRRVSAVLARGGDFTFERLMAELRWTEPALLETLVAMKEIGQVIEDLDLDTGEWVYRSQLTDYGHALPAGGMTLADRQARGLHAEAQQQ